MAGLRYQMGAPEYSIPKTINITEGKPVEVIG